MEVIARVAGGWFEPFSREDTEAVKDLVEGQVVRLPVIGVRKPRSYQQLKLFWAVCRTIAANTEDPNWNTPEKVKHNIKLALGHVNGCIVYDGTPQFIPRSIGYKDLPHIEACRLFERAWPVLAEKIDVTEAELLNNADF